MYWELFTRGNNYECSKLSLTSLRSLNAKKSSTRFVRSTKAVLSIWMRPHLEADTRWRFVRPRRVKWRLPNTGTSLPLIFRTCKVGNRGDEESYWKRPSHELSKAKNCFWSPLSCCSAILDRKNSQKSENLTWVLASTVVGMAASSWSEQSTVIFESLQIHWHFLGQVEMLVTAKRAKKMTSTANKWQVPGLCLFVDIMV